MRQASAVCQVLRKPVSKSYMPLHPDAWCSRCAGEYEDILPSKETTTRKEKKKPQGVAFVKKKKKKKKSHCIYLEFFPELLLSP